MGNLHSQRRAGFQERPQSVRTQRLRRGSDRHAAQPACSAPQKFTQRMPRLDLQTPMPLTRNSAGDAVFPATWRAARKRLSYHTDFSASGGTLLQATRSRAEGPWRAARRASLCPSAVGGVLPQGRLCDVVGQLRPTAGSIPTSRRRIRTACGPSGTGASRGERLPPFLIKGRYGEPILTRIYNNTPVNRAENGGFGRNETQFHFHNAHNGAESDGAANAHHFPGTFYDYRWSTTLARRDKINTQATDRRASGPTAMAGSSTWRAISVSCRAPCGATTTASSSPPRMSTRAAPG